MASLAEAPPHGIRHGSHDRGEVGRRVSDRVLDRVLGIGLGLGCRTQSAISVPAPFVEARPHQTPDGDRNQGEGGRRISGVRAYVHLGWERSELGIKAGKRRKHILLKYARM